MRTVKELTREELELIVEKAIGIMYIKELSMDEALCAIADILIDNKLLDLTR